MRHSLGVLFCLGLGILEVSCAEATYCPASTEQVVEMFSWWTQTGEAAARDVLVTMHQDRMKEREQPTLVNATTMDNNSFARAFLGRNWSNWRRLPDTFQANIGQDLLSWTDTDALDPVDFVLAEEPGLRGQFFDAVLTEASRDGVLYGIPLNVHRMNTLFYNRATIRDLVQSKEDVDTLEKFEQICAILKAKNPKRAPIVLGTKGASWTLGLLVHEALYPAIRGVEQYRKLWRGATSVQDEESFAHLFGVYDKIIQWKKEGWINADFAEISWTVAANRLFASDEDDRQAAFFVMGDWIQAEPEQNSNAAKLGRAPFPSVAGSQGVLVYTADTFPLPKVTKNRKNAIELLRTIARQDVQLAFSAKKGSLPARIEDMAIGENELFSQIYWEFRNAFATGQAVLGVSGCVRNGELPGINEALEAMLVYGDTANIAEIWKRHYEQLNPSKRDCFQYE